MKKLFLLTMIVLLFVVFGGLANAGPYLVCDPPSTAEQITSYEVFQDGTSLAVVDAETDGSLRYDLIGIAPGTYEWTAIAKNAWGSSALPDPYVSPALAGVPSNIRLEP